MRLPRTTGALSGLLIVLLGVWGGLIPFIGPYFHYAFGGYHTWHFTDQRLWLNIVPGAVAVIGGFMLLTASSRVGGLAAGWVAVAAGAWFAVGPSVSILWHHDIYAIGTPMGGHTRQMLEWIGYFYGLGVVIVGLAAFAMGRYFSRPRVVEERAAVAERGAAAGAPVAGRRAPANRRTAVAEDAAVADRGAAPVADREVAPVADREVAPAADREAAPVTDREAEREGAPAAGQGTVANAPVADQPPAPEEPLTSTGNAPAGTAYPGETGTTGRRRSGGLLGRFRS